MHRGRGTSSGAASEIFVGGETENGTGKTDILVRHEGANAFIGECKFWNDPAKTKAGHPFFGDFCSCSAKPFLPPGKPINQVRIIPNSSFLELFALLACCSTYLAMVIDPRHSNALRGRPVVLRPLARVVTNDRNAFRSDHVIINAHDELIITTANRRLVRLGCSLPVKCDISVL
jgi:hypothetical protein